MAAKQQDNVCLICDPDPCQCFAKPVRAKVVKRERRPPLIVVPDEEEEPPPAPVQRKPSALEAMRSAAQAAELEKKAAAPPKPERRFELSGDDAMTLQAIRNLQTAFGEVELFDGPDLNQYREYLSRPASVAERATAWKARLGR